MSHAKLSRRAAITGIGATEFSKCSGRSEMQLALEASQAAIADAGLTAADVDGLVTFSQDTNNEHELINTLGISTVNFISRAPNGGGAAAATIQHAAMAVASGVCRNVLVFRAFNERSGQRFGVAPTAIYRPELNWYMPFGLSTPAQKYALWYQRWMDKRGITNEDLGRYTVIARDYASRNPQAWFYGKPITLDDHQSSRWIVEPTLRLLDCCQESDGGVALIVSSTEQARDLPQPTVTIAAAAQIELRSGNMLHSYYHEDLADFPEAVRVAQSLWQQSDLTPGDMSVSMLYENFSPVLFMQLEAAGFCGFGESKDFVASGEIGPTGSLPTNTHGGLLGEAYIHGMNSIQEGVRQLRKTSHNQIADATHAYVSSGHSGLILERF